MRLSSLFDNDLLIVFVLIGLWSGTDAEVVRRGKSQQKTKKSEAHQGPVMVVFGC